MQADIPAISALGCHPLSVPTALTVQDNVSVFAVHPLDAELIRHQAQVLIDRFDIRAVKLGIAGIETRKEYKRFYPEGEVMAHVVGFTNVEDTGQDGMELGSQKTLAGVTGSRRVIKDRLGRIVEDIEAVREPHDGKDLTLSIDSKIQYIAFTQLKEAVEKNKAKAGGIIVVDARTGEVL
ncbi:hypothetical protein E6R62_38455, partial [Streptomyces sp. A1136]